MEDRVPFGKLTRYELMLPTDIKLISIYIKYGVLKIWIHLKIIFKNLWRPQQALSKVWLSLQPAETSNEKKMQQLNFVHCGLSENNSVMRKAKEVNCVTLVEKLWNMLKVE